MAEDVFDAGWLALREPADHRSRSARLVEILVREAGSGGLEQVVDLGGGTGSNLRYLAPRLPAGTRWTVVDHDPRLLSRIRAPEGVEGVEVRTVAGDLADRGLDAAGAADLVTASALLDLVTEAWLAALAARCGPRRTPLLLALSYDGTVAWREPGPGGVPVDTGEDRLVAEAVNRHQAGPKGMGTALGPEAWRVATRILEGVGYRVRVVPSPWILVGDDDAELAQALVEGWVEAAAEVHPPEAGGIRRWGRSRVADFRAGRVAVEVGHRDLLALPDGDAPEARR